MTQLQKSYPIFNVGVDIMKPGFKLERKYRVTMLTREESTRGAATPVVMGLIWFTDGSGTKEENGAAVYGKSLGKRLRISLKNMLQFFRLRYMLSWPGL
jgi:hypothetical protein